MGTRYEEGDRVRISDPSYSGGHAGTVKQVFDRDSDSPTYKVIFPDFTDTFNASQLRKVEGEEIEAPDSSIWTREDYNHPEEVEAAWKNSKTRDTVIIRNHSSTTETEKVPESQWVGTGGATRRRSTDQDIEAEYPDGTFEQDSVKNAIRDAKMWMEKNPDENGEYGIL